MGNPWQAVDEHHYGNGWVVLDPAWVARPRRHYCSSKKVALRFAGWLFRRWQQTPFGQGR